MLCCFKGAEPPSAPAPASAPPQQQAPVAAAPAPAPPPAAPVNDKPSVVAAPAGAPTPNPLADVPQPVKAEQKLSANSGNFNQQGSSTAHTSGAQAVSGAVPPWYSNSPLAGRNSVHSEYLGTNNMMTSEGLGSVNDILRLNLGEVGPCAMLSRVAWPDDPWASVRLHQHSRPADWPFPASLTSLCIACGSAGQAGAPEACGREQHAHNRPQ